MLRYQHTQVYCHIFVADQAFHAEKRLKNVSAFTKTLV